MRLLPIIFGLCFFAAGQRGEASILVHRILSPRSVELKTPKDKIQVGSRYAVTSKVEGEVTGYLLVTGVRSRKGYRTATARLVSHSQNAMVMVGDHVVLVDQGDEPAIPGRVDLVLRGGGGLSARYKPLVYQGISIGQTASTLDQGEHLFDVLATYSYGVTDRLMVTTSVLMNALKIANFDAKYRVIDLEWVTFSPAFSVFHFFDQHITSFNATFYFDFPTNSKLISYTAINISTELGTIQGQSLNRSFGSSLRTGYGYIFDNWDRLLFGPKFNFETQAVGGYLAYMFIWDHFHLSLNLETSDLMSFRLGDKGYKPHLFLYWRI